MSRRGWGGALKPMGVILTSGTPSGLADGDLIGRLSDPACAEAAFEALVMRHGPMVLHVCRQVLRQEHDADDAFQAVFLVLARRAGSIRDPDLLAAWLHGVALRTARLARKRRPKVIERPGADPAESPEEEVLRREEAQALHDEIGRLPENQRRAVVLCHLQGLTHEEAARRLGVPSGTVGTRLMRAREKLRSNLARRGFAPPTMPIRATPPPDAVRPSLASACLRGAASGEVPVGVASLAEGVMRTMFSLKLKVVLVLLGFGVATAGVWATATGPVAAPKAAPSPRLAPAVPIDLPEAFFVIHEGTALLGSVGEELVHLDSISNAAGAISPDGDLVAFSKGEPGGRPSQLVIQSRSRPNDRITIPKVYGTTGSSFLPLWSSDGKRLLICEQGTKGGVSGSAYRIFDLGTKGLAELKLPETWWPSDWSADGKRLLTALDAGGSLRTAWVSIDGTGEPEFITPEGEAAYGGKLSPDDRRLLYMAQGAGQANARLCVLDLASKAKAIVDETGETYGYCWSADGSKVAYTWQRRLEKPAEVSGRETLLITCNPDGTDRRTVTSRKYEVPENSSGRDGMVIFFQVFDWK